MQLVFGEANRGVHLAWLSRRPIHQSKNHRLPLLAKTLLEIVVEWEGMVVRLFATHLASRWDPRPPAEEVPAILAVLRPLAEQPHLLVGDFNALHPDDAVGIPPHGVEKRGDALPGAPRQAIRYILDAGYLDCYRLLHPGEPGYTYPSDAPWLRLDYLFATPLLARRLVACDVVADEQACGASDHLPVWAEFHEPATSQPRVRPADADVETVSSAASSRGGDPQHKVSSGLDLRRHRRLL
jgi:endonuclease/exonuclease/phosphatase family metal-dependent hydrolase